MLFFCFLAGALGSSGWMVFWAVLGMLFSRRSFIWFIVPAIAAFNDNIALAMSAILLEWMLLAVIYMFQAVKEEEDRRRKGAIIHQAQHRAGSV